MKIRRNARKLDMLVDFFLVVYDPLTPTFASIRHASEDYLGHLESRLSEADWKIDGSQNRSMRGTSSLLCCGPHRKSLRDSASQ